MLAWGLPLIKGGERGIRAGTGMEDSGKRLNDETPKMRSAGEERASAHDQERNEHARSKQDDKKQDEAALDHTSTRNCIAALLLVGVSSTKPKTNSTCAISFYRLIKSIL